MSDISSIFKTDLSINYEKFKSKTCSKCKTQVAKGIIKVGVSQTVQGITKFVSYHHLNCFQNLPNELRSLKINEVHGFKQLNEMDQQIFRKLFQELKEKPPITKKSILYLQIERYNYDIPLYQVIEDEVIVSDQPKFEMQQCKKLKLELQGKKKNETIEQFTKIDKDSYKNIMIDFVGKLIPQSDRKSPQQDQNKIQID